ncbi:sulfatase family protein [Bacteroides difficilis]|uniref:Sulfatase n=1 Tax=Bacteroides difficilis TaxID=2763021 RepID=A0ABR7C9B2_9BACE|nr:sulfatase [Bacteroides difficilis]MBC5604386.1 sulfatase [Bacteroides difficilis]
MKYNLFSLGILALSSQMVMAYEKGKMNIVFLLADDLRYDAVGYMNKTTIQTPHIDCLANDGTFFTNMYATSAISCCSRASIFTGMYNRRNGITDFSGTLRGEALKNTYPMLMKDNGYYVGFIGKYGVGNYLPQKEFDYWRGLAGQGTYYQKDKDGNPRHLTGLISEQIDEFLANRDETKPFCLSVSFKSPHTESEQDLFPFDKKYSFMYEDEFFDKPETFGENYYRLFPESFRKDGKWENEGYVRFKNRYGTDEKYQSSVKGYYRLIAGIDEAIGKLRKKLKEMGLDKNTLIIFTSDNGYYLGEHGLEGKWYGHEESIRLPLVIYDPRLEKPVKKIDEIALNIDLTSTMLDYAGIRQLEKMQGESLRPLMEGKKIKWRQEFLYEHLMNLDKKGWYVYIPQTEGLVTKRYKYMRYFVNNQSHTPIYEELFNIKKDPYEKKNLIKNKADLAGRMRTRVDNLIKVIE